MIHARLLTALAVLCFAVPSVRAYPPDLYQISRTDSSVTFEISKWMVFKERGRFRNVRGTIRFHADRIEESTIQVVIDAASLDTGNTTRDEVVRSDDFLDVARFPQLSFRSTRVAAVSPGRLEVTGDLTIRGITRRITVPVSLLGLGDVPELGKAVAFEAQFSVNRTDFGVLGSRWSGGQAILGREVHITLTIGAIQRR